MGTKLTARRIETVQSETEILLYAAENLYLRVRPTGKDWQFIYSVGGKRRKMGLGPASSVTLARARQIAADARRMVVEQIDPMAARDAAREANKVAAAAMANRHTLTTLFDLWFEWEISHRADGGREVRRGFKKDVEPLIGKMAAEEVRRKDVIAVLDPVLKRGKKRYANALLQSIGQMFRFAISREIVQNDPTAGLRKKNVGGADPERTRVLNETEIRQLADKLPVSGLLSANQAAFWLLLATACRVGELSRAKWSDIDFEACTWKIPAANAKNRREHLIHLSNFAISKLNSVRKLDGSSEQWVFPNMTDSSHLDVTALQKAFRDRQRGSQIAKRSTKIGALALSAGEWRAHDLRRTAATMMGSLSVRSDVIERALAHVQASKLLKTYQRQELMQERYEAFRLLGERLEILSSGKSDVVVTGKFGTAH